MTVNLSAFLPLVKAYAPAVPNPVAEQNLRLAARDFCRVTRCWRDVLTVAITANPFQIAPALTSVVAIQEAMFSDAAGKTPLTAASFGDDVSLVNLDETGRPCDLFQIAEDEFRVYPFAPGTVTASVYLAPQAGPRFGQNGTSTLQADQGNLPDFLFTDHADAIAAGALERILILPGQPYTDPSLAGHFAGVFKKAKDDMFGHTITGKQRAPIRTKTRWM